MNDDLTSPFARSMALARQRRQDMDAFLAAQPKSVQCERHPNQTRLLDVEQCERRSSEKGTHVAVYAPCAMCEQDRVLDLEAERLHRQGVPGLLLRATLDNWFSRDEAEESHLASVREFTELRSGFLVMLGAIGTGKSHLAVGVMRGFRSALFTKQSTLLRKLRASYGSAKAEDPINLAQQVKLLVIDEMGVSSGGRDEWPMLHEILDYRHGERLPTVLTGNLEWDELREIIGERLADRLRQSAFKVLTFSGKSHRPAQREDYFKAERREFAAR